MSDVESLALRRATLLLLLLSSARWYADRRAPAASSAPDPAALSAHAAATRAAAAEGERRSRPLDAGEALDPNRAPEEELDRLPGVGPATAAAIVAARDAGTIFRRPEDLELVRGIGPATVVRMAPFLDLTRPPASRGPSKREAPPSRPGSPAGGGQGSGSGASGSSAPVDVNRASVDELRRLPGVGPVIAERIVAERRRAPFASLDDLVRVPGIGPATVERLRGRASVR